MSKLNQWLTLVANVSVVIGIVFLAIEMRQNTEMMRAQTRAHVTEMVTNHIELSRDPRVVSAELQLARGESLSEEEQYVLDNNANAVFRLWENNFYQYTHGLFDHGEFEADLAVWADLMQREQRRALWEATRHTYAPAFRAEIDRIVAEVEQAQ